MAVERVGIEEFLKRSAHGLLIDVRSPAEYLHAHIPGAYNLPLFTDEERKIVGTTYKQQSRELAIKAGLDFFGPKMRKMVEEVEMLAGEKPPPQSGDQPITVCLYCWRGGMRSAAVAWLLNLYGFRVCTLAGGYKAFRYSVLQSFTRPYRLRILGGYTGSGKTEVLQELARAGEAVVDLEKIASHKGSAFGNINMPPQPTQEMFENLLSCQLQAMSGGQEGLGPHSPFRGLGGIWLEDESQRIGDVNIPAAFWNSMRSAPVYFLEIPFEERLKHISEEYGHFDRERLASAIQRISKRLGGLETKNALAHLQAGNIGDCFRILLQYYDKRYLKGLHNRENPAGLLHLVPCTTVSTANAAVLLQAVRNSEAPSFSTASLSH